MSASNITKFWPLIITEMMVIFSYLEKEISNDTEEWRIHLKRMATLESSWFGNNGVSELVAHDNPAWLSLYLSVCKLLDLALALPTHTLPQFQMYRWAFVSESIEENRVEDSIECLSDSSIEHQIPTNGTTISENHLEGTESESSQEHLNAQDFVPYVVRVARLLLQKVKEVKPMTLKLGEPQLTMTSICSLEDLAPFFAALCDGVTRQQTTCKSSRISNFKVSDQAKHENSNPRKNISASSSSDIIDAILERDFLESVTKQ